MTLPEANTGTKPVAESHAFDVAALERYLAARLPGFAGPLTVEQFKGGQSNPTYKLLTPTRTYVMRSKPFSSWLTRWREAPSSCAMSSCASCRPTRISSPSWIP